MSCIAGPSRLAPRLWAVSCPSKVRPRLRVRTRVGLGSSSLRSFSIWPLASSRLSAPSPDMDTVPVRDATLSTDTTTIPIPDNVASAATSLPEVTAEFPAFEPSILDPLAQTLLSTPLPAGITIILLTLVLRTSITLPITLWQRRRIRRGREEVMPRMKEINDRLAGSVARECRKAGMGYDEYRKELKKRLANEQSILHKRFRTHPFPTIALPLAIHMPLLITTSLTLRRAIELPGSTFSAESFAWLGTLGEVDSTGLLPILGAALAMANAEVLGKRGEAALGAASDATSARPAAPSDSETFKETSRRPGDEMRPAGQMSGLGPKPKTMRPSMAAGLAAESARGHPTRNLSTTTRALLQRPRARRALPHTAPIPPAPPSTPVSTPAEHLTPLNTAPPSALTALRKSELRSKGITNGMRLMAIIFIPIAAQVPSALALYWVTSMAFTLVQSLVLNRLDTARTLVRAAVKPT